MENTIIIRGGLLFHVLLLSLMILVDQFQGGKATSSSSNVDRREEQEKDRVVDLPGVFFNVSFAHYSGYVSVNENSGRSLFYWFFEAVEDPSSKPLVIWLQGGPGCSSIGFGEAEEIGPFHVNASGKTLYLNPHSWNQEANIIFLDSPVGAGFSYSKNPLDVLENGDKRTAEDSLIFLLKWFERFPQYKGRDFYITGESYAGHFIPQLAQAIVRHNSKWPTTKRSINLKGFMVGNALTDDFNDHIGVSEFLWSNGLISDQTYKFYNIFCSQVSFLHSSDHCQKISDVVQDELGKIDIYSIFTPFCTTIGSNVSYSNEPLKGNNIRTRLINEKYDPCTKKYSAVYFNIPEVQKALHVDPEAAPSKWEICSDLIFHNWKDSASSVLDIYRELIAAGLRIWMFSGDTDTVIPVTSTRYNLEALELPTASPWHPWSVDGQVGGWNQQYIGLNFVTVRGAGHKVPLTRPKQALVLFKSFLSGSPLPRSSGSAALNV